MRNGFSTTNYRKSCQRPTKNHCTTLTVELELDVSVCAQLKIFTHKNSFTWLNFTKPLYFGPSNLSQIDIKKGKFFVSQEKAQGKTKSSMVMSLNVSTDDVNTFVFQTLMGKFCQIFKMSKFGPIDKYYSQK